MIKCLTGRNSNDDSLTKSSETHLDFEDADSITDDDITYCLDSGKKNPILVYMSNYNAIATEADFSGPER